MTFKGAGEHTVLFNTEWNTLLEAVEASLGMYFEDCKFVHTFGRQFGYIQI